MNRRRRSLLKGWATSNEVIHPSTGDRAPALTASPVVHKSGHNAWATMESQNRIGKRR